MNKEQLKQKFDRFCRWQQEAPHYANRHEGAPRRCHNCGTEFADNFCPRCGQRAEVGRVGWNSIKENIAILWGMDSRSFLYTLFQLLTRPGYLVRDYISGLTPPLLSSTLVQDTRIPSILHSIRNVVNLPQKISFSVFMLQR